MFCILNYLEQILVSPNHTYSKGGFFFFGFVLFLFLFLFFKYIILGV